MDFILADLPAALKPFLSRIPAVLDTINESSLVNPQSAEPQALGREEISYVPDSSMSLLIGRITSRIKRITI
jgi:hypothetical protein